MTDETKPDGPEDDGTTALVAAIETAIGAADAVRFDDDLLTHPDVERAHLVGEKVLTLLRRALAQARTVRAMHAHARATPNEVPPGPGVS